ncbi:mortality factor 4-like protein 1 [Halyomorpha halys]|uniref:mortality factor 4-like protein 1 n=1 Tax=Halyomorpha halys TaxID=286706 RepID=UPI0006D5000E|nr:mortality factor 4-like protein 1 [Halyomorpha halys]
MTSAAKPKDGAEFKVPPKFKFQEGEKVLCFHGPLIYEAKCLQSRIEEKEKIVQYHIHYSGWNKSWDEWVPESRVLKYNEANLQRQKELHKAQKTEPKGKRGKKRSTSGKELDTSRDKDGDSRSSTPIDRYSGRQSTSAQSSSQESSSDVPKRKRSKTDPTVESEEQFLAKLEIKIKLPDELKPILVDDWEYISKQRRLVKIPSKHTVQSILDDYSRQRVPLKQPIVNKEEARLEVTDGIREYFNAMLGTQLLYKTERKQFNEVTKEHPDSPASELYGPIHLLRLFVKIGCALAYTRLDERTVQLLVLHLHDFLKFFHKNIGTYFSPQDYTAPVP